MSIIKKITASETHLVRHLVLRKGRPKESCVFEEDDLESTDHFGLFLEQEIVAIISLYKKTNPLFAEKLQYQIRGMAVLENQRKKDFGKALIEYSEKWCVVKNVNLIWFNARTEAIGFYKKMGYQKTGKLFIINDVGEHIVMFKKI